MNANYNRNTVIVAVTAAILIFGGYLVFRENTPAIPDSENKPIEDTSSIQTAKSEPVETAAEKRVNNSTAASQNTSTSGAPTLSESGVLPRGEPPKRPGEVAGVVTDQKSGYTFQQAMDLFARTGYRFELVECRAIRGKLTMKQGSKFMVDNRDDQSHQIAIGPDMYYLGAWDFSIATANHLGVNQVTCDGGGSGELLVQP